MPGIPRAAARSPYPGREWLTHPGREWLTHPGRDWVTSVTVMTSLA